MITLSESPEFKEYIEDCILSTLSEKISKFESKLTVFESKYISLKSENLYLKSEIARLKVELAAQLEINKRIKGGFL